MKGILIHISGLGDLPHKLLNNMTPLEAANIPNLDFFAARGELGYMHVTKLGVAPGSDEALVSMFGNDTSSNSRGQLEAAGKNIKLTRGDLVLRINFATIDNLSSGNIIDRRAGRTLTNREVEAMSKSINKISLPIKFEFIPTLHHRALLILRGGFSEDIVGGISNMENITLFKPTNEDEGSYYTANTLNEFFEKAHNVLENHPVNDGRKKMGLLPANYLLAWGGGIDLPKVNKLNKWFSVSYMPLEIGFSKASGMEVFSFDYPEFKGIDSYENLWNGLRKACDHAIKTIKKYNDSFEYAYIHLKETDFPGHDNKPLEKKMMLEHIDKTLFDFLREFAPQRNIKIVVTSDHSTPCKLKSHSSDPVPVLLYNFQIPKERHFNERESLSGSLGNIEGKEFLRKIGFDK